MSTVLKELRPTLALAFPIIVGHMSQMLIGLTDSAFIGRVGTAPLAPRRSRTGFSASLCRGHRPAARGRRVRGARPRRGRRSGLRGVAEHGRALALAVGLGGFGLMALLSTQLAILASRRKSCDRAAVLPADRGVGGAGADFPGAAPVRRVFRPAVGADGHHPGRCRTQRLFQLGAGFRPSRIFRAGVGRLRLCDPARPAGGGGGHRGLAAASRHLPGAGRPVGRLGAGAFRGLLRLGGPAGGMLLFEAGVFSAAALMMGWLGTVALRRTRSRSVARRSPSCSRSACRWP